MGTMAGDARPGFTVFRGMIDLNIRVTTRACGLGTLPHIVRIVTARATFVLADDTSTKGWVRSVAAAARLDG